MRTGASIAVINPLPRALAHYTEALVASSQGRLSPCDDSGTGVEVAGRGRPARAKALTRHVQCLLAEGTRPVLSTWPVLGHLETGLLALRRGPTALVFHDPDPLDGAAGHGRYSRWAGTQFGRSRRIHIVAHSIAAEARLREIGYPRVHHVPHPLAPGQTSHRGGADRHPTDVDVAVLGQHKPTRNTALLAELGPRLRQAGLTTRIRGRGWMPINGWDVAEGFLPEAQFTEEIGRSRVIVIPYERYWQSGVALRALEMGRLVVGPEGGFLPEVLGATWPGLVPHDCLDDPRAWEEAILRVMAVPPTDVEVLLDEHRAQTVSALALLLDALVAA